ncbi:cell division protein FtsL [Serpentinicella sp. ANB-PHB4]|nr:cell division protein FtsL [Serpentinicella sp. ANB-PHB4]
MVVAEKKYEYNYHVEEKQNEVFKEQKRLKKQKKYSVNKVVFFSLLFIGAAACLLILARYVVISGETHNLNDLTRQLSQLENQKQTLEIEYKSMTSSRVIQTEAINRFDMRSPNANQYVHISVDREEVNYISKQLDNKFNSQPEYRKSTINQIFAKITSAFNI